MTKKRMVEVWLCPDRSCPAPGPAARRFPDFRDERPAAPNPIRDSVDPGRPGAHGQLEQPLFPGGYFGHAPPDQTRTNPACFIAKPFHSAGGAPFEQSTAMGVDPSMACSTLAGPRFHWSSRPFTHAPAWCDNPVVPATLAGLGLASPSAQSLVQVGHFPGQTGREIAAVGNGSPDWAISGSI